MKRLLGLLMMGLASAAMGCGEKEERGGAGKKEVTYPYKVVATTGMVADIVRAVAGDKATVETLMKEGVDPHLYTANRDDMVALGKADVIMYSGLLLEGKMSDTLIKMASGGRPVHAVTELIDKSYLMEGEPGHDDPHVWMDPTAWQKAVLVVGQKLGEYDPANAAAYQANAQAYNKQLDALHAYAQTTIQTIPKDGRVLITAHDAFNYFGTAYDMEVLGIQGISTESEAGLLDIQRLVDLIVRREVKAVFVESTVSEKNVRALIEGARSKNRDVKIGGMLFSDAMGRAGTYEGTYIGMIDHNVTTIVRALGGEAPARGMNGKLSHGQE